MRDELWILGDFSYRLGRDEALAIRQSIACRRIHLVPGNHDRNWAVPELDGVFILEPPIAKIKYEGHRFVCSHYPIMDWEGMRRGSIQLHGHIHSRPEYNERNQGRGLFRYDVGVDANGYRPVSIEEVVAFFDDAESGGRVNWREWDDPRQRRSRDEQDKEGHTLPRDGRLDAQVPRQPKGACQVRQDVPQDCPQEAEARPQALWRAHARLSPGA